MTEHHELAHCPFCGSTNTSSGEVLSSRGTDDYKTQTGCLNCGATGPAVPGSGAEADEKADQAWNTRWTSTGAPVVGSTRLQWDERTQSWVSPPIGFIVG